MGKGAGVTAQLSCWFRLLWKTKRSLVTFMLQFLKVLQYTCKNCQGRYLRSMSFCLGLTQEKNITRGKKVDLFVYEHLGFLRLASTSRCFAFFHLPGQLRSWTCPPSGRSTNPHCSIHRSPPSTPPTSAASCRSRHPLLHHACSEPCPKWKRTQG